MVSIIKRAIDEWDPMGLFPLAPDNEYQFEIRKIAARYSPTQTESELSEIIADVFTKAFDHPFSAEKCTGVAAEIIRLRDAGRTQP